MRIYLVLSFFLSLNVLAADWETIYIPKAKCGDGVPYKIFFKQGDSKKLAIELMAGGACWSLSTCWGPTLSTWIHPIPKLPVFSYLTSMDSPIRNHTFVYFPYCTGDVYAGDHKAEYLLFTKTYHYGRRNVALAIEHLKTMNKIDFKQINSFVLYGSSAGGIGSLIHKNYFDQQLKPSAKKVLISDSPGLHFGQDFWKKFTDQLIEDFKTSFSPYGIEIKTEIGTVAPQMVNYCKRSEGWKIGFIQTTRDIIMSLGFGNISQDEHEELVLGPDGLRNVLKNSSNCSTHISEGYGHALLILKPLARNSYDIDSGESVLDYLDKLLK